MKKLLLFPLFLILFLSQAQNRDDKVDVGPEYKALFNEFDACVEKENKNCVEILNKIIEKGKHEKVQFLDYLYGRKAFYFWGNQELDSTMAYSKLALQNPNPIKSQRRDVDSYNLLANSYYYKGDLKTAIKTYLKIAAILEDGGNPVHLGYLYSNIATLLGETNNDDKQLQYLQKAFKLLDENKDERFIATIASNLGLTYYHTKDTINAIKWSDKALDLSQLSNDLIAKTQSYLTLSLIEKDSDKSLKYAEQSVLYADQLKNETHQAAAYYRYAAVLNQRGESEKGLNFAERAVDFAQKIGDNITLSQASYTAANIAYELGLKERASEYYRTYAIMKDSVSSVENVRAISEIQTKYETEKKEKQIAEQKLKIQRQQANMYYAFMGGTMLILFLLGFFIYNRKLQQLKLKQLQQEKEKAILNSFILGEERERKRISHELHDGIAAMLGAANMSLESIPHLSPEKGKEQLLKVRRILENSHRDIRHIAHNLLPTVLEEDGLIQATEQFVSEINDTQLVNISVIDKSSKVEDHSKQIQLMLFRVIQELVNNIIKHSQAQNAEIVFSNSPKGVQIEISDDGRGYEDNNDSGNHGLYSIAQRLKSIGGNFKISKGGHGGTRAKIALTD